MVSPNPNPNPYPVQQPVYYRRRRSIAGPVILIVIGIIILLRNVGMHLPWGYLFSHYWPVLLILWGLIRLVESMADSRHGYTRSSIGAGSIVLLILIVIAGTSANKTSDWNWNGVRDELHMDDDFSGMFGNSYTFDDTLEQTFPAKGSLRVVSDRGGVTVTPSDGETLRVVVHKKLHAGSQEDANKYNDQTKPQITAGGSSVLLNANTNGAGDHAVESDLEVFVPREATVDIASKHGDVSVNDRKADVKVNLQHGDVSLNEITGSAQINLDHGSVRAAKVSGDVDIDGHLDDVTLEDIGGAANLHGEYFGNTRLSKVAKMVTFKTSRSDVTIASVGGDLDITSDTMRGTDLVGPTHLVTKSKDIHLEGVSGDLLVETSNGGIEVSTAKKVPVGRITLTGKHGDISVELPANAGFQMDATTRKGDITSDFGGLQIDSNNGGSRATGTVGNGAAKLQINSDTGDIRLTKG